jgi:hypothetical protein
MGPVMTAFIIQAAEYHIFRLLDVGISQLRSYPSEVSVFGNGIIRTVAASLHITLSMATLPPDPLSGLADHDSHVDMSSIPAVDQPADGDDE